MRSSARDLSAELADAEQQLDQATSHGAAGGVGDIEEEVQKAMDLLQRIEIVCADSVARSSAGSHRKSTGMLTTSTLTAAAMAPM